MFKSIVLAFAQAQENLPVSRAEMKAQLAQLERAGTTRPAIKPPIRPTSRPPKRV